MSYASVDPQIQDWAQRHALKLFTSFPGREVRGAYVSSISGECFQIWIEPPEEGQIHVYVGCVEGRREDDPDETWRSAVSDLGATLDRAFQTVTDWMAPSKRFFPPETSN